MNDQAAARYIYIHDIVPEDCFYFARRRGVGGEGNLALAAHLKDTMHVQLDVT